jgi:alpha,alpha-trehalose phosphorylase
MQEGEPRRPPGFDEGVMVPQRSSARDGRLILAHTTRNSRQSLACAADHELITDNQFSSESGCTSDTAEAVYSIEAARGQPIQLVKYLAYHTSPEGPVSDLCHRAERTLGRARRGGFESLITDQRAFMDDFWERADVEVEAAHPRAQQCLRFNLFHLLQASARAEENGIGARGLTGQAYEGHYFWDTEIYVLPFLIYTSPRLARNVLKVRYRQLDFARLRAREVSQNGGLFPWRTISGEEASAYYAAGTAQYHINADIVYALRKYVDGTADDGFLEDYGAEILVETARLWEDLGFYPEGPDGEFHIHGVTGPDEYNTVVDDNCYTNLMARENLWYAAQTLQKLRERNPERFAAIAHDTGLEPGELDAWQLAADRMHVPFDEARGIHPQDETFLHKEVMDIRSMPAERFPLLLHYHPLVIYRHQVIKQADIVLAMFLLGHEFSLEQKRRNFAYYDPITTGDSSLSVCIQAIVAWELGEDEKAFEYFRYAVLMDLADIGGNVKDGAHIASMGGTWMSVVYGIGGMRDYGGKLGFRPRLPARMKRLCFRLAFRGRRLRVELLPREVTYTLVEGRELTIEHYDEPIELSASSPVTRDIPTAVE